MAISPDNDYLAIGGSFPAVNQASFIEILDLKKPLNITRVEGVNGNVLDLKFSSKGTLYILDNQGRSIKQYIPGTNSASDFITSKVRINDLALSPDDKSIVGAGEDGAVYRWSLADRTVETIDQNKTGLNSIAYSPDGKMLAYGDRNGMVYVYNFFKKEKTELEGQAGIINDLQFNSLGDLLASASSDKTVRIYNITQLVQKQPIILNDHSNMVQSVTFTPDGKQLVSGIYAEYIKAWPIHIEAMADRICGKVKRNLSPEEWEIYVATDIPHLNTCPNVTPETSD